MNITLFIDADNISYYNYKKIIDKINLDIVKPLITIKIFGNFTPKLLNRWQRFIIPSSNTTIQFINIPIIKKKNITDHVIIVEAMKCLYTTDIDIFALASDDVDFIPLYEVYREHSKTIWQISQNIEQTQLFESLVDVRIDVSSQSNIDSDYIEDAELIDFIDQAIEIKSIDGYALLGDVKYWLDTNMAGFTMERTKYKKFSKLVLSLNRYEITSDESEFKIKIKA